ncbi:MAG: hypothetical protein ACRECO_14385 [Xanthobacteraceae bacterium]
MFLRDWFLHPPSGVGIAVIAMLAAAGLQNHYQQIRGGEGASADYSKHTHERLAKPEVAPFNGVEIPPPESKPNRQEWRSEQELKAQRQMVLWAFIAAIAACASVFVTAIGVAFVKWTLDATRAAVDEASKGTQAAEAAVEITRVTAERELRAYLSISKSEIKDVQPGRVPYAHLVFRNDGNTPAAHVQTNCRFNLAWFPDHGPMPDFAIEQKPSHGRIGHGQGMSAFPDLGRPLTADEFENLRNGRHAIFIYGSAFYTDIFGKTWELGFQLMHGGNVGIERSAWHGVTKVITRYVGAIPTSGKVPTFRFWPHRYLLPTPGQSDL